MVGVGGGVARANVRLGLDDARREQPASPAPNQQLAEQEARRALGRLGEPGLQPAPLRGSRRSQAA
jgi:hypothetical protein